MSGLRKGCIGGSFFFGLGCAAANHGRLDADKADPAGIILIAMFGFFSAVALFGGSK